MPTKRELRLNQQEELRQTFKLDDGKVRVGNFKLNRYLVWGGLGALVLAGLVVFFVKVAEQPLKFNIAQACLRSKPAYHVHPELTILINGKSSPPPKNIGVSPNCMLPLHTHANDGVIHTEPPGPKDLTLGQFFTVWGKTFNKDQILDFKRTNQAELILTVDGQPNSSWENLVLKDKQKIIISYTN